MLGAYVEAIAIEMGFVKCFAKIKFGQIISEARGKVAGMVFSKNRSGSFIRTKATPIQPRTIHTQRLRSNLSAAAKAWQGFSDTVRAEFTAHADEALIRNSLGDKVRISGFNFYIALCRNAFLITSPLPVTYPGSTQPGAVTSFSAACSYVPDKILLTFAPEIPTTDSWVIYATRPMSLGRKPSSSDFRFIGFMEHTETSPFDITTYYVNKYGGIPKVGTQGWLKITPVSQTSFVKFKAGNDLCTKVR